MQVRQNKVGIYLRLSKDDERQGESLSIENQKLILERYVNEQGWILVDTYIDDGYSGTTFDRPGVQRLLEDAKIGIIDTIIVKDLSRFGRNYIHVGQYIDYIFPMYNIRFIALNDNVDTANSNSSGMDMMPIMNVFNEWHAANTSKKIRAVIEASVKSGNYRSSRAPYGYIRGKEGKHLPVIDEPAAKNVRRIFEMRASGISPKKIAEQFNKDGILIPTDYHCQLVNKTTTKFTNHLWTDSTVKQILVNPTYLGHTVQLKNTTISYKNKTRITRPESEQVKFYNVHEPIISQELWDKVREMEKSVSRGKSDKTGVVKALSGLCYCADCGNKMYACHNNTRHSRKGPRIYFRQNYNCGNHKKFGSSFCVSHYIKMKSLDAVVLNSIKLKAKLVLENEAKARKIFLADQEKYCNETFSQTNKRLNAIKTRLSNLDKLIQSTYEDKVLKNVSNDICVGLLNKYQDEKIALQKEMQELDNKITHFKQKEKDVDEFIKRVKKYAEAPELTREMCLELIEFVTVDRFPSENKNAPRDIHIYFKLIDNKSGKEFSLSKRKN